MLDGVPLRCMSIMLLLINCTLHPDTIKIYRYQHNFVRCIASNSRKKAPV